MAKTIVTKYGTKINVEGLTPEQVARVRKIAEENGAYGAKGAALAKTLQQKNGAGAAPGGAAGGGGATGGQTFNADSYLAANPDIAREAERLRAAGDTRTPQQIAQAHWDSNGKNENRPGAFGAASGGSDPAPGAPAAGLTPRQQARLSWLKANRPKDPQIAKLEGIAAGAASGGDDGNYKDDGSDVGTEGMGDTYKTVDAFLDEIFSGFKPLDLSGQPSILDPSKTRQEVYDSIYQSNTKNLERDRQRDLEETKQELAQRGIPIDFSGEDLYSKSINSVHERYDQRDLDAKNAATMGADQSVASQVQSNATARQSFLDSALAGYGSQLDAALAGGNIIGTLMQKYGIDEATAQQMLDRKTDKWIAKAQINANKPQGGGGGGGSTGGGFDITIGGMAP